MRIELTVLQGIEDSVKAEDTISPAMAPNAYQAADIYVLPTLCLEGHALSLLEAMASGLACVTSNHDTALSLYSPEEMIFVNQPNLINAFVKPIVDLLHSRELRESYGYRARQAVLERFTYEHAFARYAEFYRSQLALISYTRS
jgi:glycosyltransferase involved in cell wall biosynthesis